MIARGGLWTESRVECWEGRLEKGANMGENEHNAYQQMQ